MRFLFASTFAPRPRAPTFCVFVHQMARALCGLGHEVDVLVPVRVYPPRQLLRSLANPRRHGSPLKAARRWMDTWAGANGILHRDSVRYLYRRFTCGPSVSRLQREAEAFVARNARWLRRSFEGTEYSLALGHFLHSVPLVDYFSSSEDTVRAVYVHEDVTDYRDPGAVNTIARYLRQVPRVFTNSRASAAKIEAFSHGRAKGEVLHLGIDDAFRAPIRREPGPVDDRFRLIYVSRFVERKNQEALLLAVNELNRRKGRPRYRLELMGDHSPSRARIEALAGEVGARDFVCFSEATDFGRIIERLRASDVFVFPSQFESFGLVLLEAASQGLPVISSRHVGAATELEEMGWPVATFDPSSPGDLMSAIEAMDRDYRARWDSAQRLGAFVAEHFSWTRTAQSLVDVVSSPGRWDSGLFSPAAATTPRAADRAPNGRDGPRRPPS